MNKNPNTKHKHTKTHNRLISASITSTHKSKRLSDCIIKMTKGKAVKYALNGSDAAKMIGVSRQQVYQVLSENRRFRSWKTAAGWTLQLVKKQDAKMKELKSAMASHLAKDENNENR